MMIETEKELSPPQPQLEVTVSAVIAKQKEQNKKLAHDMLMAIRVQIRSSNSYQK